VVPVSLFQLSTLTGEFHFPQKLRASYAKLRSPFYCQNVVAFGNIAMGKPARHEIKLLNAHFSPVEIKAATASCGCTVAEPKDKVVSSFHRTSLIVKVTPKTKGAGSETVEITTNRGIQHVFVTFNAR